MKILVDKEVANYLKSKKRNVITLYFKKTGGGWCGTILVPEQTYEVPEALKEYNEYKVEDITVYIKKDAIRNSKLIRFELKKILFFKTIVARGLDLPKI